MFNGEWGQQCCMKDTRSVDERHEVYEEQRCCYERHGNVDEGQLCCTKSSGGLRRTRGAWTKDTKCTKNSGAATKDTRSVDEGQLCCTKSSGAATKDTEWTKGYLPLIVNHKPFRKWNFRIALGYFRYFVNLRTYL